MSFVKQPLFVTHVYQFMNPSAAADHEGWRKAVLELRERDRGRVVSNQLGWQSSVPLQTVPQLGGLGRLILSCLTEVGQEEGWALDRFNIIIEGWANINGKMALNNLHNHPNCLLSGCYYIDVPPDSGDILFRDPREAAYMYQPPYLGGSKPPMAPIKPQPGMLLIFPSWLLHAVGANLSDSERMSIAFNANVELKPPANITDRAFIAARKPGKI